MRITKKYFKLVCAVIVAVMVSTLISGCSLRGNTSTAPKTFVIWGFDDEDVWKPIIKEAQKASLKDYDVKYAKKTLDDSYENNSLNSILSGQGPDVWAIPNDWVYRHKDKLAPMPDSLIKSSKINLDDQYVPAIKQSGYFDGKIYSLSPVVDSLMIYYNPTLMDSTLEEYNNNHKGSDNSENRKNATQLLGQIPSTWSTLIESSKLITQRNGDNIVRSGIALGTSNNIGNSDDILYALMLQNGAKLTSDDFKLATFNLPQNISGASNLPGKSALDFYTSFANPGSVNYSWSQSMPDSVESFTQDKVAMIIGYGSLSNYLAQIYPNFKYKKAPLPQIGISNETVVDFASYNTYVVPKLSNNASNAWSFILSLSGDQASTYSNTVKLPVSNKNKSFQPSLKDREGSNSPDKSQSQTAQMWVKGRYPKEINQIIKAMINNVNTGQQDSQTALDTAANATTNLLRKDTW